jgi:hypothetical protein
MPFVSTIRHKERFIESPATARRLGDIRILLESLRRLEISLPVKKRLLVIGIWEVALATGNFYARHRSEGVIRLVGAKIQRDHIFQKRTLVEQLLGPTPDFDEILQRARCCIVTDVEHQRLHQVNGGLDGWDRYRAAKISVYDMVDETRVA